MDVTIERTVEDLSHRIAQLASPDSDLPRPRAHDAATVGSGYSGCALALLYAGEVLDDSRLRAAAQNLLKMAAETTSLHAIHHFGLFDGLTGFARVVLEFKEIEPRYYPTFRKLAEQLGDGLLVSTLPEPGHGIPLEAYDVTRGASGQLATAVRIMNSLDQPPANLVDSTFRLTDYLMRITDLDDHGRPGWLVTPPYYPVGLDWYWEQSPHGMYNLGFAHGMPGILAALCAAASAGIGGSSVEARVRELALWLTEHARNAAAGPTWPTAFNAESKGLRLRYDTDATPARAAWCYGAPGISLALLSASSISGQTQIAEAAVDALRLAYSATSSSPHMRTVTLCHGNSGLAAIAHRAASMTGMEEFVRARNENLQAVIETADPVRPFLFADRPEPTEYVDDPGLLTGAAGVLLSLLAPLAPTRTSWDEILFLTSPSVPMDQVFE